jgi:magnesium-transporting ATPase (P-type)
VQYVLSDKTGTLTQNVMGFVWASVDGKLYGKEARTDNPAPKGVSGSTPHTIALDSGMQEHSGVPVFKGGVQQPPTETKPAMDRFLLNLALCNTVVPSIDANGKVLYQVRECCHEKVCSQPALKTSRLRLGM